ncbi:MAG: PQQ-binding-like beta-propeller repeat protein [Verrucomicrobiota bacterium]
MRCFLLVFLFLLAVAKLGAEPAWPEWRGPLGTGVTPAKGPTSLDPKKDLRWKVTLPGRGTSTPAVAEGRVFLTAPIDGKDAALCYSLENGELLWQAVFDRVREPRHRLGSSANPSPVTDGEFVYCYFKSGTLMALDLEGQVQWEVNIQKTYGKDTLGFDLGTSPVLIDEVLLIAVIQRGDPFLLGLDPKTGRRLWKTDRDYQVASESAATYSTPAVAESPAGKLILSFGADRLSAHEARSGKFLWDVAGFNPENRGNWRTIASPVVAGNTAIVTYGRGDFLAGVRFDEKGGEMVWNRRSDGNDVPTPATTGNLVWVLSGRGNLECLEADSGERLWDHTFPKTRGKYWSSPVLAGSTIYCVRDDGTVFTGTVTARDGLEKVQSFSLGEEIIASPVVVEGICLIRTQESLFCFEG